MSNQRKYLIILLDLAMLDHAEETARGSCHIVAAISPEEAKENGVQAAKAEAESVAAEDDGYIPLYAFSRDDLQAFLNEMSDQSDEDAHGGVTPPAPSKRWLVNATVRVVNDHYADHTSHFVVEAPDIRAAEDIALRILVPEGFSEERPFAAWAKGETEAGEWTTVEGYRAFQLSDEHALVDAGNIFFIRHLKEVNSADAAVLIKNLHHRSTDAEVAEQRRLRLSPP